MYRLSRFLYFCYKKACYVPALLIAAPFIALGFLSDRIKGEITHPALALSRIPFFLGELTRSFFYKALLVSVGRYVTFKYGAFCHYRNAAIGHRVLIGYFNSLGEITIGDNVLIGGNVNFLSGLGQHGFHDPAKLIWDTPGRGRQTIHIGSDVWIGSNSLICCDVSDRCVIAAGSVVIKPIDAHTVAGGNPAKALKRI